MEKYYVMYWNDRADYPVAVFEVEADSEGEAEEIAYENGGDAYADEWPLLTETELTDREIKEYKSQSWKTDYVKVENK